MSPPGGQPNPGPAAKGSTESAGATGGPSPLVHPGFTDAEGNAIPLPPAAWETVPPSAQALIMALLEENAALRVRVEALEERLRTNSTNSSKPPSSDPPGTVRNKNRRSRRRRGGQKGHHGHFRALVPVEDVDHFEDHFPEQCERCRTQLGREPDPEPIRHQVTEVPPVRPEITEHRLHRVECPQCLHVTTGELRNGVPTGAFGPRLMAVTSLLTGRYRMSRRDAEGFLDNVLSVRCSLGGVKRVEEVVSRALAPAVQEVGAAIQQAPVVGMDESTWKERNKRAYMWNANTDALAYYVIAPHRDQATAQKILGEGFDGILGTDRFAGYNFHPDEKRQACLGHIDRDFKKIEERGGASERIGAWAGTELDRVFKVWHRFKDGEIDRAQMQDDMAPIRARLARCLHNGSQCGHSKTEKTCANLLKHFSSLWVFVRVEGVEPTNNASERAIRPGVRWRRVGFGTQSKSGSRYVERMLTTVETCRRQGRNLLEHLTSSIKAMLAVAPHPSLLPPVPILDG